MRVHKRRASQLNPPDAVILAGGKGVRLRALVSDRPKTLADVAGRPFVEWLLLQLVAQGLRRVILATGYKGEMVESYLRGKKADLDLVFSREPCELGTGGALRHTLDRVTTDRVLVLNGDSFCRYSVGRLLQVHEETKAKGTLWLVEASDCTPYGSVDLDAAGRIVAFHEKMPRPGPSLINAGVYLLERSLIEAIPADRAVSLESDVLPGLAGRALYGLVGPGPLIDIGTPEAYLSSQSLLPKLCLQAHSL